MAAEEWRGDFTGFTFNGHHSSEYHLIRVSGGKNYEINVALTDKDTTVDIPGRDGVEFIKSKKDKGELKIKIAFDSVTEQDLRGIKQWLNKGQVGELYYDETPYKYWMGKISKGVNLNFVCFDGPDGQRVYKGDGEFSFTCFCPYARSRNEIRELIENKIYSSKKDPFELSDKTYEEDVNVVPFNFDGGINNNYRNYELPTQEDETDQAAEKIPVDLPENLPKNLQEWLPSSGIIFSIDLNKGISPINQTGANNCSVYNGGDMPTPAKITIDLNNQNSDFYLKYTPIVNTESGTKYIYFNISKILKHYKTAETTKKFIIDNDLHLILKDSIDNTTNTQEVMNDIIDAGDFFNIEVSESQESLGKIELRNTDGTTTNLNVTIDSIDYDYLYY